MDIHDKLMRQHVPYEVWMLQATSEAIAFGRVKKGVAQNAFIESFAVHARGLIDFFNGKDGSNAADFTDASLPSPAARCQSG